MVKYENYPPVKETTFLKIFWTLQTLVLLPAILQTLETWTHIRIEPPQLMMHLLSGFAGFLIISELLFLTYLITAVLAAATVYILVRKKGLVCRFMWILRCFPYSLSCALSDSFHPVRFLMLQ